MSTQSDHTTHPFYKFALGIVMGVVSTMTVGVYLQPHFYVKHDEVIPYLAKQNQMVISKERYEEWSKLADESKAKITSPTTLSFSSFKVDLSLKKNTVKDKYNQIQFSILQKGVVIASTLSDKKKWSQGETHQLTIQMTGNKTLPVSSCDELSYQATNMNTSDNIYLGIKVTGIASSGESIPLIQRGKTQGIGEKYNAQSVSWANESMVCIGKV